jgi:hypothetical protein
MDEPDRDDSLELESLLNLEPTEPYTFAHLNRKLGWDKFCELTGTNEWCRNEGFVIEPNEIFYIKVSDVNKYLL